MLEWEPFLGPFHSVLLHLPIGFLALALLLDLYARRRSPDLRPAARFALGLTCVAAAVVALFGLWRAGGAHYDPRLLAIHKWGGISVVALVTATFAAQRFAFQAGAGTAADVLYRSLFVLTLATLVVAGHFGGSLAHGSRYLVKNAPDVVKDLLGVEAPEQAAQGDEDAGSTLFVERVRPIFAAKCMECHGRDTQQGGYRLDVKAIAFNGPPEGGAPPIVPTAPLKSDLVRRILLNPDYDSDAMPPLGTESLTPAEILTIVDWIQRGAVFVEARATATSLSTTTTGNTDGK
jgi:uncharacterized membrane protein/mono/diheme cytochrome c family protein